MGLCVSKQTKWAYTINDEGTFTAFRYTAPNEDQRAVVKNQRALLKKVIGAKELRSWDARSNASFARPR